MASGKVMANPDLGRNATKAELEAKLREANAQLIKITARVTNINKRLDQDPTDTLWYWYISVASVGLVAGMITGVVIWLISLVVAL